MRIGELSRRTGVSGPALRYYEEQGLLHPRRRSSGYREYSESDVAAVGHIRMLLAAGLGTGVIAEVLPCMASDGGYLAPGCPEITEVLVAERERISGAITALDAARQALEGIITAPVPEDADALCDADAGGAPAEQSSAERAGAG
ncbi:MerR family transcriptional regulator [Streptomonospora litoralis]|uniref:HTH-type transcriptional regulator AdhR n=1 Tax=Streptomonospora litoralis TaxID=2498135 RepID=A0A4P6QAB1_9ACTN|nr:MerR family transcriptional regulator [Streptomonospora litoralis]QBI56439.1 HTH-type transcriptional regulator AdhR [Streptomonospora litoralis]